MSKNVKRIQKCEACRSRGWLLAFNADRQIYEIQRCDTCQRFDSDKEAGEEAVPVIEDGLSVGHAVICAGRSMGMSPGGFVGI